MLEPQRNIMVKICGLTDGSEVRETVSAGPDALGFNFWPKSPRAVSAEAVAAWGRDLPEGILKVGVFVDQPVELVRETVRSAGLDVAQLHGSETAAYIRELGEVRVWKALHLDRLPEGWEALPVERFLVDSGTVEMPGGTGVRVDTARAKAFVARSPLPVLLAGGLNPDNVGGAVAEVRPAGVDVSSGVEHAPGRKDMDAVRRFIRNARGG